MAGAGAWLPGAGKVTGLQPMTEPGKNYRWSEFQRENKPKRHRIHNAPHSHTIITQIMAKMLQSHMTTKSRRETQDATSYLKNKLVRLVDVNPYIANYK
jgi:hypothetical protein